MENTDFKLNDKLTFDIYGQFLVGKYHSIKDNIITVEVIKDASGISNTGEYSKIHKDFLV